jgi:Tfp pilus assembly protein PilF
MAGDLTQRGTEACEAGERAKARRLFALALREDPRDERAWFGLSQVVEGEERRRECLERVLTTDLQNGFHGCMWRRVVVERLTTDL